MILGVLSDTHGNHQRTRHALTLLDALGATAFVHCGDICGDRVIDEFARRRAWLIPGNCDHVDRSTELYAATLGVKLMLGKPLVLNLAGRQIAVFHGHELAYARLIDAAEDPNAAAEDLPAYDYVLHGHTHEARDERIGRYRFVNPGALYRAATHTVATIDLATHTVAHWVVTDQTRQTPTRFELTAR